MTTDLGGFTYPPFQPPIGFVFSLSRAGAATATNFLTLVNPMGSPRAVILGGVFISAVAAAASATEVALRGFRVTEVSGGILQSVADIGKFNTGRPDPVAEVRTANPLATVGPQIFNSPPPTSTAAYSSGFVHQIPVPAGFGGFVLRQGEGIVLRISEGDTAQRWNMSIVWGER